MALLRLLVNMKMKKKTKQWPGNVNLEEEEKLELKLYYKLIYLTYYARNVK